MRISLLCLTDDIYSIGPRRISAQLKRHGFDVRLIFAQPLSLIGQIRQRFRADYADDELSESFYAQLVDACRDSAIVGMSLWSHQAGQGEKITTRLRRDLKGAPIVWGGIHPTSFPEESIRIADAICLGEGEISFLAMAEAVRDGRDYSRTPGFWFRDGANIMRNPPEPLVENLDDLPFLDFDYGTHVINDNGIFKSMTAALMKKHYGGKLWLMFSQGCPYKCSFCSNDLLIDLDDGYRKFRHHSVDYFMAQLRYILARYPDVYNVIIDDDAYMFLPIELIREFATKYRRGFSLPFFVSGIIPASVDAEKFRVLFEAGMIKARIGVQSANPRIMKDVFVRPLHDLKIFAGSEIAYQNRRRLAPVSYDLIVDNPWEHPEELKDTLRLVHRLRPPYAFSINSLTLLPGTTIHRMGKASGFVENEAQPTSASYVSFMPTVLNLTLAFYNIRRVPEWWFRRVIAMDFGNRTVTMKTYPRIGFLIVLAGYFKKTLHETFRGDIHSVPRPFDCWVGRLMIRRKSRGQRPEAPGSEEQPLLGQVTGES